MPKPSNKRYNSEREAPRRRSVYERLERPKEREDQRYRARRQTQSDQARRAPARRRVTYYQNGRRVNGPLPWQYRSTGQNGQYGQPRVQYVREVNQPQVSTNQVQYQQSYGPTAPDNSFAPMQFQNLPNSRERVFSTQPQPSAACPPEWFAAAVKIGIAAALEVQQKFVVSPEGGSVSYAD